jgi:hypothetical protein
MSVAGVRDHFQRMSRRIFRLIFIFFVGIVEKAVVARLAPENTAISFAAR